MSTRVRIYELSKELGLENREILRISEQLGIKAKSASSTVTEEEALAIRKAAPEMLTGSPMPKFDSPKISRPAPRTPNLDPPRVSSPKPRTPNLDPRRSAASELFRQQISNVSDQTTRDPSPLSFKSQTVQSVRRAKGYREPHLDVGEAIPLHMVLITGGSFMMGSPDEELERSDAEGPQHKVTLQPFFMGRYPVTQAQWRAVAKLPRQQRELDLDPSHFKGDNRPVERVSWYEAVEFCARLSAQTHRDYRLPTEAEWEYACRAGTKTPFYFGQTITDELANYNADYTYASGVKGQYREETTDVNHFGIGNAFGLSDMHGNVDEWCQDHWHLNYQNAPSNGSAWLTGNEDARRIVRGGSWGDLPRSCRSATRFDDFPADRTDFIGFRVSCSSPRSLQ